MEENESWVIEEQRGKEEVETVPLHDQSVKCSVKPTATSHSRGSIATETESDTHTMEPFDLQLCAAPKMARSHEGRNQRRRRS